MVCTIDFYIIYCESLIQKKKKKKKKSLSCNNNPLLVFPFLLTSLLKSSDFKVEDKAWSDCPGLCAASQIKVHIFNGKDEVGGKKK